MATPTVINANVNFEIRWYLTNSPKDITWKDLSDYTALGFLVANSQIILKITGPLGVMYQNAGWLTDSFAAPDITRAATAEKTGIPISLDANLAIPLGEYVFECKVKDTVSSTIFYGTKTYDYQYVSPTPVIDLTVFLRTSQLQSVDASDYLVTDDDIAAYSTTRAHTITKPAAATGCNLPATATTTDVTRLIGAGATEDLWIWTGDWAASLVVDLVYKLEDWNSVAWQYVYDQVTGSDSISVSQNTCFLQYYETFKELIARYASALGRGNSSELNDVNFVLEQANYYWMQHELADRNGDETEKEYWCTQLTELVTKSGYVVVSASDNSEPVVPWGSDTIVSVGTTFAFTNGVADPTGGNAGDYYFKIDAGVPPTTCVLWFNNAGTWTALVDLKGATGAAGDNTVILYSSIALAATGVSTGVGVETLLNYAMPGATLSDNGSGVEIEASIALANNAVEKTVQLRFSDAAHPTNTIVVEMVIADEVTPVTDVILISAKVFKKSATTVIAKAIMTRSGSPSDSKVVYLEITTAPASISNITISADAAAGDVTCNELTVSNIQIIP